MIPSILIPSLDASTVAGQFQWFLYGFGVGTGFCLIAFAIKLFRMLGRTSTEL
jgi:hypothetical protein